MKRKILGLLAIVLALSLSAFNAKPAEKKFANYFWFALDVASGEAHSAPTLIYQSFDPQLCASWYWGGYCEGAYTSFTGNYGEYWPWGTMVQVDFQDAQ